MADKLPEPKATETVNPTKLPDLIEHPHQAFPEVTEKPAEPKQDQPKKA